MILFLVGIVAAYACLCYVLASNYVHPMRVSVERPADLGEVEIPTRFGPTPSWITPGLSQGKGSKVIFVLAHGYGGTRESWATAIEDLKKRGFDSVTLAMPGQDASPVKQVGFGVLESHVIVDAVHWIRSTYPGHKVVVLGVSMGGAATWLATAEDPSLDGIVTDCAFARFDEPMNAFFERKVTGGALLFTPVIWIAKGLAGVDPAKIKPVDAAALWRGKPALVIQGDQDTLVVPSHAERLSRAAGCPLWMVPGATHARAYEVDTKGYLDHLASFAKKVEESK